MGRIARDLNDIAVEDGESLLISLILDGKLDGRIDQVKGILVKKSHETGAKTPATETLSVESQNIASLTQLTLALEHLTDSISKAGSTSTSSFHKQVMQ